MFFDLVEEYQICYIIGYEGEFLVSVVIPLSISV